MTIQGPDHVAAWNNRDGAHKHREMDEVMAWFKEHGAARRIVGGEELGWPHEARTVRKKGISDGPFIETKEMIGGFIVVEVASEAEALEMAAGWPGLRWDDDAVEVHPVGSSPDEVAAQEATED
jgi:hypothetical protein